MGLAKGREGAYMVWGPIKMNTPGTEHNPSGCLYLFGEPKEMNWCNKPRKPKSSYCEEHHAVCWVTPGTEAWRDEQKRNRAIIREYREAEAA